MSSPDTIASTRRDLNFRWWHGFSVGLCVVLEPSFSLLGALLILPYIIARVFEKPDEAEYSRVIAAYIGVAAIYPCLAVWSGANAWESCVRILMDPKTLLIDWVAAGCGWFIFEASLITLRIFHTRRQDHITRGLENRREHLIREWGLTTPHMSVHVDTKD
ncbi:hypothetical protein AA103196_0012 [Ameyamaea chiangmaiensis NBRC 103196]|uniref:Transmembrane protein n=1 Tax=Ameyamaea chiangmaiensis TaxID=442969 RepID=A0A850P826_9PROT|nr:hypothetical protein [Ameyamaea chiangmaiensis]MBS4076028.1 hypothetical protein [Ameyamaea chiangmaiensis]NVN40104.1 hypothetical protein [Ameyamaea chiangmaiensis]GBQ61407.1 hypothetical protein AA103196_0012 [Ameyamaea chiangmaiensis NBRC 103196]